MTPLVSIVIVSFNTKDLLRKCVQSIYETTKGLNYEVIIVDNASRDGSPEAIEHEFNHVRVIRNSENCGFAKANNQAIRLASGKYLLLLNSDTIMKEGTIERLVSFLEKDPRAAAVGPKVLNPDGTLQNKGFCFPSVTYSIIILFGINRFFSEKVKRTWFPKFYWSENDTREVDYLEGSCLLLRKEVIDRIGLLPEAFFMYFEEAEWCCLAKKHQYGIWYFPGAEIIHLCAASPLPDREEVFGKSLTLFYKRNIGRSRGVVIAILSLAASFIDLFVSVLFRSGESRLKNIRDEMRRRARLLRGVMGPD
jgi:hypothetical protein